MNTTKNIRIAEYPLTHVDCVEKAICVLLSAYGKDLPSLYLMYLNLFRSYNSEIKNIPNTELGVLEYLCKQNVIPLTFVAKKVDYDASLEVDKLIAYSKPCLVPGDLYELFYSKHYHINSWPHLFVIDGARKEERLFFIMDSVHKNENEHIFSKFVMQYNTLTDLYKCYCNNYKKNIMYSENNVIYHFDENISEKIPEVDILSNVRSLVNSLVRISNGSIEKAMLEKIKNSCSKYGTICTDYNNDINELLGNVKIKFARIIKRKEVLFNEITNNLSDYITEGMLNKFNSDLKLFISNYNAFFRVMVASCLRGNIDGLDERLNKSIAEEQNFIYELNTAVARINNIPKENAYEPIWNFENNNDNNISEENGVFIIKTKKECNCWIKDESIKIMLNKQMSDLKYWRFVIHMSLANGYVDNNYHCGISFRTNENKLFYWGSYNSECIRLSDIGIKLDVFDVISEENISDIYFGVIKQDNLYKLYYKTKGGQDKYIPVQMPIGQISEIGIGCKTWESNFDEEFVMMVDNIIFESK
ncbi:hypothetical protein [Inconstantimicrobium mannanitabidum]|uniref:Uncharacterized protein n=1 Tax=Inconstantimicrobium mannanitabidum TaxID=1604901 RepID=A0ACB5RH07_9CLOT|nr:hypothetical protein [Clostridium sp. TW13]GKX68386.1 hypothetical protein rsdtw13_36440 [Clostridium sp. TW13]